MNTILKKLLEDKEDLEDRIKIQETGNDSYYLSDLYQQHKHQLYELNNQIDFLKKTFLKEDKTF